jgi:hypothetical protein
VYSNSLIRKAATTETGEKSSKESEISQSAIRVRKEHHLGNRRITTHSVMERWMSTG